MPLLTALLYATPLFGFALTPPGAAPGVNAPGTYALSAPILAQLDLDADEGDDADADGGSEPAAAEEAAPPARAPSAEEAARSTLSEDEYTEQLRQRNELGDIHRALGIATWASMLVTVALGIIQYINLYGGDSLEDTPCVQGNAIFGQDQCWGTAWPHRIAAMTTTALYATTFTISFIMPDPDGADQGNSAYAENLRIHKALRWVHLVGMVAQIFLGFASGQNWFGLDRANDFEASRGLAAAHMGIGLLTFGALTGAAAVMLF